jgi:hypothetical protein
MARILLFQINPKQSRGLTEAAYVLHVAALCIRGSVLRARLSALDTTAPYIHRSLTVAAPFRGWASFQAFFFNVSSVTTCLV